MADQVPTLIDGGLREYEFVWMDAVYLLRDTESGALVRASQQQVIELGTHQAALRDSLVSGRGETNDV